jgi:Transcriptional Coactivator p15 (PC4)
MDHVVEIDSSVQLLKDNQYVKLRQHIGGSWYVSVTTGYWCVDLRKFYLPDGQDEVRPTRTGIALRLREWNELKLAAESIRSAYPSIAATKPCYLNDDHMNQLSALSCRECYPFM